MGGSAAVSSSESTKDTKGTKVGKTHMKYKIALYKSEEGYSVSCPGLPGCWSQGETEEAAIENIQDAIKEYIAVAEELIQDAEIREVEVAV
jgi:predicted RNase H-like HicB family nuclease